MAKHSKRYNESAKLVDYEKLYSIQEAVNILKKMPKAKFDETVELVFRLGVDPRHSDQAVRSTVVLPHGVGKKVRVLVFAKGETAEKAKEAGADFVGYDDLIAKIQGGWTDFDAAVATPDAMRDIGKLGKVLGPRGLMPTPKTGTVTPDVLGAVKELKAGKIDFRVDKAANLQAPIGKVSFPEKNIVENAVALFNAVQKAKPSSAKGLYMKTCCLTATMSPGIHIDMKSFSDNN
ncbi:MAG: 50S ribosomal protein L1 [Candidatus Auribacterota bacterium]|jgi:large subunit ribosomal protein L1